jgi:PIN domain nuclease of toxin-antitoxin system
VAEDRPAGAAVVLDASAVLALLRDEPGAAHVAELIPTATISAVNLAEVLIVLKRHGVPAADARHALDTLALDVLPADIATAHAAAGIAAANPRRGLSLGDCFCLATAHLTGRAAVTADRKWATLKAGAKVEVVR